VENVCDSNPTSMFLSILRLVGSNIPNGMLRTDGMCVSEQFSCTHFPGIQQGRAARTNVPTLILCSTIPVAVYCSKSPQRVGVRRGCKEEAGARGCEALRRPCNSGWTMSQAAAVGTQRGVVISGYASCPLLHRFWTTCCISCTHPPYLPYPFPLFGFTWYPCPCRC
jgi:hypothetical protein